MRNPVFLLVHILSLFLVTGFATSIRGKVEGPRGVVAKAEVTLLEQERRIQSYFTDAQGEFSIENLAQGTYQLQVVHYPYLPVVREIVISDATPSVVELNLQLVSLNETVTVTAGRLPVPVATAISNVKILSGEELRQMPYQSLDERLRSFPEFSLFRRSSSLVSHPTTQGVSLRGIGPSGVSRSLVLADGVPLNDAFGGWVYWDRIPALSLQQVEVANGGGSTLYGNYALGGVVQLLKRIPEPATFEFQGQGGSNSSLKGDFYGSHRIGPWGISLAGSFFDFDGYPLVAESQRGTVDIPASSRYQAVRFYAERAAPQSSWIWSLDGGFLNEHRANGTPLQNNATVSYDVALGTQWSPLPFDRIEVRTFFRRNIFASTFSAVASNRNSETLSSQQHVPSAEGGASLLWFATRGRHQVVAGSDLWLVSGQSTDNVFIAGRFGAVRLGGGKQATVGLFAEENFSLSWQTAIVVGGRVDFRKNFDGFQGDFPPDVRRINSLTGGTEVVFSPCAGFTYAAHPMVTLYGSVYRSFRAPTLNELYRPFRVGNVLTQANSALLPERNTGFEVGMRFPVTSNLRFGVSGFFNFLDQPISNITLQVTPALITRQRRNLGAVRVSGLEASATWQPVSAVKMETTYLWNRSRVTEFTADPTLVDKFLPQVPEHRWTFQTEFSFPQAFRLALLGRVVGDQFDDDLNQFVLDRYFQLDAHISRGLGEMASVFLALENMTDARIVVNRSPVDFLATPFQIRGGIYFKLRRHRRHLSRLPR